MGFNPDEYLKQKSSGAASGFDPDAYLKEREPAREGASPAASAGRKLVQGATAGFSDELSGLIDAAGRVVGVDGAGSRPIKDISANPNGPTLSWDIVKEAYEKGRNHERETLKQDSIDNPSVSNLSEFAGGIASPLNGLTKGMGLAKAGAVYGGVAGAGSSESEDMKGVLEDAAFGTAIGGAGGKVLGKIGEKVAPVLSKATNAVGQRLETLADSAGFKASGAMLKDFRVANDRGKVNELGRFMHDNKMVSLGDTVDDVAAKAATKVSESGAKLDRIYTEAKEKFGKAAEKVGFNPIRDRREIIDAAKKELGNAEGAGGAVKRLETYLDEVAERHFEKIADVGPVRASDFDVAMDPRATNDIKSAMDKAINYSRNPLSKEPAAEAAFSGARTALSKKVDEGLESLGGDKLLGELKAANKDYGQAKTISNIAGDRINRESANQMFSLTDKIAGGAGLTAGAMLAGPAGIPLAIATAVGSRLVRKYGSSTIAVAAERASKLLMRSPEMASMSAKNPKAFQAAVMSLVERLEQSGALPKAAKQNTPNELDKDSSVPSNYKEDPTPRREPQSEPVKGKDKWANDGFENVAKHSPDSRLDKAKLLSDPKSKQLLVAASDLKPGSRAMKDIVMQLHSRQGKAN